MTVARRRIVACPVCHDWASQHKDGRCTAIYEDEENPNVPIRCGCTMTEAEIIALDDARLETLKLIQTPALKKIDLFLGDEHNHLDIKTDGRQYLAKIRGRYWCGCFNRQWYGLYFMCGSMGFQFDTPGTNSSKWEALWEIVDDGVR